MILPLILLFLGALGCAGWFAFQCYKQRLSLFEIKQTAIKNAGFLAAFVILAFLTAIHGNPRIVYSILSVLFLIVGSVHTWLLFKKRKIQGIKHFYEELLLSGLTLFLGGFVFVLLSHFVEYVDEKHQGMYNSSIIPYSLPLLVFISLVFWRRVPKLVPKGRPYNPVLPPIPPKKNPLNYTFEILNREIVIDIDPNYKVGKAFDLIVNEASQMGRPIPVTRLDNNGNEVYLDWFFTTENKKTGKIRYMNPELTFEANYLRNGDNIRIRQDP